MRGWVYVISNPAMPGRVKVGYSNKDPNSRAGELGHTGSSQPYIVEYDMLIDDPFQIEQKSHKFLSKKHDGKEWFLCSVGEAVIAIQQVSNGRAILENFKKGNGVQEGVADAQNKLGIMYDRGEGVPQDYVEAVKWHRKSAEQGNANAQFNLGIMYANGRGVPKDYAEAVKWYRKSAEQGNAFGQSNLGYMYAQGRGVPKDYAEAVKWYRKAAELGDADAQNKLGIVYGRGQGIPQDYVEAVKWFRKSAEQGNANAQFNFGTMYANGQGVPQDYVEAHKWFNLATARSSDKDTADKSVKNSNIVAAKMTPAQIAEAETRAREWKATK